MDVRTATRTIEIFESFARTQTPLSLTDLARQLNAPVSSCLYLVRTLENRGYLYSFGSRKGFYPSRKMFDVASTIAMTEPGIERMEPILKKLRDETQETIILGKRQGKQVVYLLVYEGTHTIRYSAQAGDLKPLHSSAIGKALLGLLSPADFDKLVAKVKLDRVTPNTITTPEQLRKDVADSADQGYAISRGENVNDVMAIGKAFQLGSDDYGMAIAGPIYRILENKDALVTSLIESCAAISKQ